MKFGYSEEQLEIQRAVQAICARYDLDYWLRADTEERFPEEFYADMVANGYVGLTLPESCGGGGLSIADAVIVIQAIVESGAGMNGASTIHSYVFAPQPIVKHGTAEQQKRMLTPLTSGKERACFGISEPNTGLDTTHLKTRADWNGTHYIANGTKLWPTMGTTCDRIMLLARTTPIEQCKRPVDGISLFYAPMDRRYVNAKKIPKMGRNAMESTTVFIDNLPIDPADRIGEEGKGFQYILDGLNPERILLAGEAVALGRLAVLRAAQYAKERVVFGRPIGQNQGIQHPLAKCWMQLEAAQLMVMKAATLYDSGEPCGAEANTAKFLAGEAGFEACTRAVMTHGGFGYAREYHVERYLREAILLRLVPVSIELIMCYVAERVLGLPKSY
jgi:acyl-CoA dehydrogenase